MVTPSLVGEDEGKGKLIPFITPTLSFPRQRGEGIRTSRSEISLVRSQEFVFEENELVTEWVVDKIKTGLGVQRLSPSTCTNEGLKTNGFVCAAHAMPVADRNP